MLKGRDNRNELEMNGPSRVGTWILFGDGKSFVDFFHSGAT